MPPHTPVRFVAFVARRPGGKTARCNNAVSGATCPRLPAAAHKRPAAQPSAVQRISGRARADRPCGLRDLGRVRLPGMSGFKFGPGTAPRLFAYLLMALGFAIVMVGLLSDGPPAERYTFSGTFSAAALVVALIPVYMLSARLGHFFPGVHQDVVVAAVGTVVVIGLALALMNVAPRGPVFITAATLRVRRCGSPARPGHREFLSLVHLAAATEESRWIETHHLGRDPDGVLLRAVSLWIEPAVAALAAVLVSAEAPWTLFANLWFGFGVAVTPTNLGLCLIGTLVGTLIGVLPGIGPLATIAMLLPITFGLPPVGALIMLAGIYYGAQYGGSTTVDSGQHPRRSVIGGDVPRRPPDGAAGPRRPRARHRRHRLVLRRLRRHRPGRRARRAADHARAAVRPGRIFLADGARASSSRSCWRKRLGPQGDRDDPDRACCSSMVGTDLETGAVAHDLRHSRSSPTASASSPSPWACSASPRSCATSRNRGQPRDRAEQDRPA